MSQIDRSKWDQRYAERSEHQNNPVSLVTDWLPRIPVGRALDVACGAGRNALLLAETGFAVDAIDISPVGLERARQSALEQGFEINWIEHDLDQSYDFDFGYDLILVLWFVNLELVTRLCEHLAPGGYLICQEHLITGEDVIGPRGNDFRVTPGGLHEAIVGLEVLFYDESVETVEQGDRLASARVVARRTAQAV